MYYNPLIPIRLDMTALLFGIPGKKKLKPVGIIWNVYNII